MQKLQHRISKKLVTIVLIFLALPITVFLVQHARGTQGSNFSLRYTIYEDALVSGWKARSWASRINLANPSPVYSGSKSISFTPTARGARLYLYTNTAIDITSYSSLHFAAQASRAGQDYTVTLYDGANKPLSTLRLARYGGDPVPGTWKVYNIPLSDLRAKATHINGVAIQSRSHRYATLYLDSMSLTGLFSSQTPTPTPSATPAPTASGELPSSKLTWAPPQLTNPETLNLTTNPQNLNLDKTKDYILKFPSTPIVAQFNDYAVLNITGGHNIVMIGGEIHIPDLPDTQNGVQGNDNQRQAMRLDGNTGTVFIEGLEVSGTCMDFMDISAPQARVILQNVRVEGCRSHDESLSDGYTDEHPDLIQPWGGAKEIDIDGFTGFSDYQGFQLNSDLEVVGNIVVKHANIGRIATVPQYGRYFMWQDCNESKFRDCATNADAPDFPHWDLTDDSFYIQPADNRSLDDSVWPSEKSCSCCRRTIGLLAKLYRKNEWTGTSGSSTWR